MIRLPQWLVVVLALAVAAALAAPARAADNPPGAETLKGKVQSVAADHNQFVVRDNLGRDWTCHLSRDGKVRINDKEEKLSDLKEGDEVTVTCHRSAREVYSARGEPAGEITGGRIEKVSADQSQLTLKDHRGQERTFMIAQDAKVRVNDRDGKASDLKEGDRAIVGFAKQGDQLTARDICSEREDRGSHISGGQVQGVAPEQNQLRLKDHEGRERTFHLGREARVRLNDQDAKLADLKEGDHVAVAYRLTATEVDSQRGNK